MNNDISIFRKAAAKASGGTSNNTIYDLFISIIVENKLRGVVVDFGAGIGTLTKKIHELSVFDSINSIDILPRPLDISNSIQWANQDLNLAVDLPGETFDVAISSEVIEHLENPRAVLREWHRMLKEDGYLLFSTPNNESWRSILALIFRGHYSAFGEDSYPAHITPLLRKDIERILKETGFHLEKFYFTDVGIVPKCRRLTWQNLSFGWLKGVRFSDNVLVLARK